MFVGCDVNEELFYNGCFVTVEPWDCIVYIDKIWQVGLNKHYLDNLQVLCFRQHIMEKSYVTLKCAICNVEYIVAWASYWYRMFQGCMSCLCRRKSKQTSVIKDDLPWLYVTFNKRIVIQYVLPCMLLWKRLVFTFVIFFHIAWHSFFYTFIIIIFPASDIQTQTVVLNM